MGEMDVFAEVGSDWRALVEGRSILQNTADAHALALQSRKPAVGQAQSWAGVLHFPPYGESMPLNITVNDEGIASFDWTYDIDGSGTPCRPEHEFGIGWIVQDLSVTAHGFGNSTAYYGFDGTLSADGKTITGLLLGGDQKTKIGTWEASLGAPEQPSNCSSPAPAPPSPDLPVCPGLNTTRFPPMGCGEGTTCCTPAATLTCREDAGCTACPECCHANFAPADQCAACVRASCDYQSLEDMGCAIGGGCCHRGVPLPPSTSLPNCLLVGDSVTHGQQGLVASKLRSICQTQTIIGNDAAGEAFCWPVQSRSAMGKYIAYDVVHFNEGLHSLWPRVNDSSQLQVWADQLAHFTQLIKSTQPNATLVYATMTPWMPEKFAQDGRPDSARSDLEQKNEVAVATVRANGVERIHDLYSVVTDQCGQSYKNCSVCSEEAQYHGPPLNCPDVQCGYHYNSAGWQLLAQSTADAITAALESRKSVAVAVTV